MRIGIVKPGKKIFFYNNELDHASWSKEVTSIIEILARAGHKVFIMSPTDYRSGTLENVYESYPEHLNMIVMWNGVLTDEGVIPQLKSICDKLVLIVTDLALLPKHIELFDTILTQSKRFHAYGHIEENVLFDYKATEFNPLDKKLRYYFGGTERNRLGDILEYVWRPECFWKGKSAFLNKLDYVPYYKHLENVKDAMFTIIIGDEDYNKIGFVTPRYYEALKYDVIAFVDCKYDPDCLLIPMKDFRRVSSYKEMYLKMKELENDTEKYSSLIKQQRREITQDKVDGANILKLLTC